MHRWLRRFGSMRNAHRLGPNMGQTHVPTIKYNSCLLQWLNICLPVCAEGFASTYKESLIVFKLFFLEVVNCILVKMNAERTSLLYILCSNCSVTRFIPLVRIITFQKPQFCSHAIYSLRIFLHMPITQNICNIWLRLTVNHDMLI